MEANFCEIGKRRKSKGLSAAIPAIYDPDMQSYGAPDITHTSPLELACHMHSSFPERMSMPIAVSAGAQGAQVRAGAPAGPAAVTGEEAAHKRRRASTAGGGARTKGVMLLSIESALRAMYSVLADLRSSQLLHIVVLCAEHMLLHGGGLEKTSAL